MFCRFDLFFSILISSLSNISTLWHYENHKWTLLSTVTYCAVLLSIYLAMQQSRECHVSLMATCWQVLKHDRIIKSVPTAWEIHHVCWPKKHLVIRDEYNLQLEIFLIAEILGLGDINPTQAISIPSNPTECCIVVTHWNRRCWSNPIKALVVPLGGCFLALEGHTEPCLA